MKQKIYKVQIGNRRDQNFNPDLEIISEEVEIPNCLNTDYSVDDFLYEENYDLFYDWCMNGDGDTCLILTPEKLLKWRNRINQILEQNK